MRKANGWMKEKFTLPVVMFLVDVSKDTEVWTSKMITSAS